jgi:hypothetical protein
MKFNATILLSGKTATGIEVPAHVVKVTVNRYQYRSTVAPMGGVFMLPISAEHRAGAGVNAGDNVLVTLTLDTEERTLTVPADFLKALADDARALSVFEALSYSRKQRLTLPVEHARTAETRERRIDKAIADLREGRT